MAEIEKPKEEQAPAYFVMYAALWCIMLAFFVTMLTMGKQRVAEFREGLGEIRNQFGTRGGFGLFPYWRNYDKQKSGFMNYRFETKEGEFIGYLKGMLWKEGLSSSSILKIDMQEDSVTIYLMTPLVFLPGSSMLSNANKSYLSRIAGLFYNRTDLLISIYALLDNEKGNNTVLATRRAAVVSRYLSDVCLVARDRLTAVGYASKRYLDFIDSGVKECVIFVIKKEEAKFMKIGQHKEGA